MTTTFDSKKTAAEFATRHVLRCSDLQTAQEFPQDLWREMGKAGLFKIGIPETHGGTNGGYLDLLQAGEAFVRNGCNLGLGVSWIFQQIVAAYIMTTLGTKRQREKYLPAAANGQCTFSFAVSEPKRGASPKMLTTSARKQDASYCLEGEKAYLTNGPIADIFIIIAVTGEAEHKRSFTAFIAPRDTQGLNVMPPMPLTFLKPSPHGGIQLNNCIIGEESVLGREGCAWQDIVVPLGEIEDTVMAGPVLGGMAAEFDILTAGIRGNAAAKDRALQAKLGSLHSLRQTLQIIAYEAAGQIDRADASPLPQVITFARLAATFAADVAQIAKQWEIPLPDQYSHLARDLESLGMLQKRRLEIRQEKIGRALLENISNDGGQRLY